MVWNVVIYQVQLVGWGETLVSNLIFHNNKLWDKLLYTRCGEELILEHPEQWPLFAFQAHHTEDQPRTMSLGSPGNVLNPSGRESLRKCPGRGLEDQRSEWGRGEGTGELVMWWGLVTEDRAEDQEVAVAGCRDVVTGGTMDHDTKASMIHRVYTRQSEQMMNKVSPLTLNTSVRRFVPAFSHHCNSPWNVSS